MNEKIMLASFVAVEGAHAFSAFMPSVFTVRKFAGDPEDIAKLREGYKPAVLFNLALGASVSVIIDSPAPLVLSVLMVIIMVSLYENAISKQEREDFLGAPKNVS